VLAIPSGQPLTAQAGSELTAVVSKATAGGSKALDADLTLQEGSLGLALARLCTRTIVLAYFAYEKLY